MESLVDRHQLISALTGKRFSQTAIGPGPGWHTLVNQLCICLIRQGWNRRLYGITSHGGGLRFLTDTTDDRQDILICAAEYQSFNICEQSGEADAGTAAIETVCNICQNCRMNRILSPHKLFKIA